MAGFPLIGNFVRPFDFRFSFRPVDCAMLLVRSPALRRFKPLSSCGSENGRLYASCLHLRTSALLFSWAPGSENLKLLANHPVNGAFATNLNPLWAAVIRLGNIDGNTDPLR